MKISYCGSNVARPAHSKEPETWNGYLSLPLSFDPGRGNELTVKTK